MNPSMERIFAWFKAFYRRTSQPGTARLLSPLPWIVFLLVPPVWMVVEFAILFTMAFMFDSPHTPLWFVFFGGAAMYTAAIPPLAWLVCLVLYLRPVRGRRAIYCWIPLLAIAFHYFCLAAFLVFMLTVGWIFM